MAEPMKPWEGLSNPEVLDAAPAKAPPSPTVASSQGKPWEGLDAGVTVLDAAPEMVTAGISDEVAAEFGRASAAKAKATSADSDWLTRAEGWLNQVGRAAFFDVPDGIMAKQIYADLKDKHPGLTEADVLKLVKARNEAQQSMSADVAGFLAPGLGVGKAVTVAGRAAGAAATRAGLTQGAMKWAASHPWLSKFLTVSAEGAGGGALFEAVRESTDQAVNASVGGRVDPEDIVDATITGGVVGALLAPPLQGATNAAISGVRAVGNSPVFSGVVNWAARTLGLQEPQAVQAAELLLKSARHADESLEQTAERLGASVQAFKAEHGRAPALAEVMAKEQVEDISNVIRHYGGLDQRVTDLTDRQIGVAIQSFDDMLRSGGRLKDTSTIEYQADRMFNTLMRRYGKTEVDVPDDTLEVLAANTDWLMQQVKAGNMAAKEVKRVVDARTSIGKLRRKFDDLAGRQNVAVLRSEVADMQEELATLVREAETGGQVPMSEMAELKSLIRYRDALVNALAKSEAAGKATMATDDLLPVLRNAETILAKYERDGLKVRLSDANMLRRTASRHANSEADAAKRDIARSINNVVSQIGKAEVPRYGDVVRLYSLAQTRSEAQAAGRAAVRGSESPENLGVWVRQGRSPEGVTAGPERLPAVRQGAEEGAKLDILKATQGTRREARQLTGTLGDEASTGSRRVQEGLGIVTPRDAGRIVSEAGQVSRSIDNLEALARVKSPSSLSEAEAHAKELAEVMVSGRLGGAALAGLAARLYTRFRIPRGVAKRTLEMLADPEQGAQAVLYLARHGVDLGEFYGAIAAELERTAK